MKVKVTAEYFAINKKGKEYVCCDEVDIDDKLAKELIAQGKVEAVKQPIKPKEEDK